MTLNDLVMILASRWRTVVCVLVLIMLTVGIVNFSMPKQYRALATVVVDVKGADPVAGTSSQSQVVPGYLATQVGVVSSNKVVRKVILALGLDKDPALRALWEDEGKQWTAQLSRAMHLMVDRVRDRPANVDAANTVDPFDYWLVGRLAQRVDVRPAREGSLIDIAVKWEDPALAASIANAFASAYIDTNLELKVEPAKQYVSWFEERNQALRKNLERAQARLSEYQRTRGIVASSEARLDIENARLNDLSSQLTVLLGTKADSESRELQVARSRDNMVEVLQNPVIVHIKGELATLESKYADTVVRYGPNYPDVQRLEDQIRVVKDGLQQEIGRVAASLKASNQINTRREAEVRAGLDAQRQRVLELSRQRDQISVLQNDVSNAQRAYDTVTQRLAQTSLESQNQMTNVMVITPALQPLVPDSPRIAANLILGAAFGLLLGVAVALSIERFDQRLHGAEQLRALVGAPVFGVLGQQRRASALPRSKWVAITN